MSEEPDRTDGSAGELRQFEKNRFFEGKLMTARDMETEQTYHAGRFHLLNRLETGSGILRGLSIDSVEERDGELAVTVEPGVAVDRWGRPIVVEHTTTTTLAPPNGDEIYLFLSFAESSLESVPVPDVRGASEREHESNRTVEGFELTYRETPPEREPVPEADTRGDGASDPVRRARSVGDEYHRRNRSSRDDPEDPAILVGAFERDRDDDWVESDASSPQLAYDNEMLYAALIDHVTDTENPHETAGTASAEPTDAEEFGEQVQAMRAELDELSTRLDTLNRYLMRKTLKEKVRFFTDVATRFEEHDTEGSRIAHDIVERSREGIKSEVYDDPSAYREHVGSTLELDINLGEALDESATEESLERYVAAVSRLQTALEDEAPIVEVAEAQDGVCEAADSLELLYDIVRDE